jgi:hypothetical protein
MGIRVKYKGRKPYDDGATTHGDEDLCCWCYKIESDTPFERLIDWGLDFDPNVKIQDPLKIDHCNDYKLQKDITDGEGKKRTIVSLPAPPAGQPTPKEFTICFVAPCKGHTDVDVSLDHYTTDPNDDGGRANKWRPVKVEGGNNVYGPKPG